MGSLPTNDAQCSASTSGYDSSGPSLPRFLVICDMQFFISNVPVVTAQYWVHSRPLASELDAHISVCCGMLR